MTQQMTDRNNSNGNLKGKVALVTGASRGIGYAIATALAQNGINIAINSRSVEDLERVTKDLSSYGVKVLACPADLSDPQAPAELIEDVIAHFGQLDILINNAGIAIPKALMDTSAEEWDRHMAINARAPFLLSREAVPHLKKSNHATIINISSVVGTKGYINQGAYTASKHALVGMTKVLAQEVFDDGIRVHIIAPGGVATEMVASTRPDLNLSDMPTPSDIAEIVMFLLTHRGNAVIDEINVRRSGKIPWK
ncbi:MAG: SDR family NAD(P)-dependent oxidoreductase [Clostridia bacterium]|nr:SDR family NAD(P)-dependent oxidoreductase [Clostridia bacterium]